VIPQLFVHFKQAHDFQLVFLLLMVPCYLYILYFALRGHRIGHGAIASTTAARDALSQN